MSITGDIREGINRGDLVALAPRLGGDRRKRKLYLRTELYNEIFSPVEDDDLSEERRANLIADLESFITRNSISPEYLKGLQPKSKGVFEIRSVRPKPSVRVFCFLAAQDTLICTHMVERTELGGFGHISWQHESRQARSYWRALFPTHAPLTGDDISTKITGATSDLFDR